MSGWGSLDPYNCPDVVCLRTQQIELETLDSMKIPDVRFIKIDVEGHELEVLCGAQETIRQDRPHLLIEVREKHLSEIRNLLNGWNYFEASLENLCGVVGSPQNYIFLPSRRASPSSTS